MKYRGNLSGIYDPVSGNYIEPPTPWQRFSFNWKEDGLFGVQSVLIIVVLSGWGLYSA